ncbi:winged helix-turn-helix domain-containing protein [Streptomyces klenkii]|uniref:winged helix-turn-helix domain-containing protein n=1 Tax=Streptomyces klenkii TaxID=1420899 RepID=UPI0033B9F2CD
MPERPSDPHAPRAPYMRVLATLLADIESGKYSPGDPIPSEAELCKTHGVARETARRAVRVLRERGIVETEWGKGSRVTSATQYADTLGDGSSDQQHQSR